MFKRFFKKKEERVDAQAIVQFMLQNIYDNENLHVPRYLPDVKSEADADELGIAPVVYVWNEDRAKGSFNVSVNGNAIAHLLEGLIPRTHSQFNEIRDQVAQVLSESSRSSVVKVCESAGKYPSEIFEIF